MEDLKITLIQTKLHWENPKENRTHFGRLLGEIPDDSDLILLPEMFTTGFTMNPEKYAEPFSQNMPTLEFLRKFAKSKDAVISGSVSTEDSAKYYNRLFWVRPDGSFSFYDKRHLFTFAEEDKHYSGGDKKIIEEIKGWKILPLTCYDLRFPVWSRNRLVDGKPEYDLLTYVANWPAARSAPWSQLLPARANENQAYVAGLNRVGKDGNGIDHSGDSIVISPKGETISAAKPNEEQIFSAVLSREDLERFREKFPVLHDGDDFSLNI
ncbi:amidohydrolase [Halocola ammonii]